jgi:hypothetical protein
VPFDQIYVLGTPEPMSVTLPPWQKVVGPELEIVTIGLAFSKTAILLEVSTHPFASVPITKKFPEVLTSMELPIWFVFH